MWTIWTFDVLLAKAKLDVEIVEKKVKERSKEGGLVIKVSHARFGSGSGTLTCASGGAVLLFDKVKFSECLVVDDDLPDDCLTVERWGALLKWSRVVNCWNLCVFEGY